MSDARLAAAAQVHLQVLEVQKALQEELGVTHEAQARAAAQEGSQQRIQEIFSQSGLSESEYSHLLFMVGTTAALQERFERLVIDLQGPAP